MQLNPNPLGCSMWRILRLWCRRGLLAIGTITLSAFSVFGVWSTISILHRSPSWSGLLQSLPPILCSALGIASILTSFRHRRWQAAALLAWVAACTFTAGVVPVLQGGTSWLGALSGGSAVLGVAGLIALVQRAGAPGIGTLQPNSGLELSTRPPGIQQAAVRD